jgi:hypothetical protein
MRGDIVRAYDIFGQPPEYVRGKLTKKKVNQVTFNAALRSNEAQTLWCNVMHIDQSFGADAANTVKPYKEFSISVFVGRLFGGERLVICLGDAAISPKSLKKNVCHQTTLLEPEQEYWIRIGIW